MHIVVNVAGRQAVPLRAVAFATGWLLSHDIIARGSEPIPVYRREDCGTEFVRMTREDWITIDKFLGTLTRRLVHADTALDDNEAHWWVESLKLIPTDCFVWLQDLEASLSASRTGDEDDDLPEIVEVGLEDDGITPSLARAKPFNFKLSLSPVVPPELEALMQTSILACGEGMGALATIAALKAERTASPAVATLKRADEQVASAIQPGADCLPTPPRGLTYWNQQLHVYVARIDKRNPPRATPLQAIAYLKNIGDKRLPPHANASELHWFDNFNSPKVASQKTVANALLQARKWAAARSDLPT